MKILAICATIAVLLLTGCAAPVDTPRPDSPSVVLTDEPPTDVTWISPGKVNVDNFYPGASVEYPLTIHNGNDTATSFSVKYRYPDHVGDGHSKPAEGVQDWVIIANSTPVLMPKETGEVLIVLGIPEDADRWSISVWNLSELGAATRSELQVAYQLAVEKAVKEGDEELPRKPELLMFLEGIYGTVVGSATVSDEYADYVVPTNENEWEFWVSVIDTTQKGMIQTELASRWLISMR